MTRKSQWKKPLAVTLSVLILLGLAAGAFALSPAEGSSLVDPSGTKVGIVIGESNGTAVEWRVGSRTGDSWKLYSYDFNEPRVFDVDGSYNNLTNSTLYQYLNDEWRTTIFDDIEKTVIEKITLPLRSDIQGWSESMRKHPSNVGYWLRDKNSDMIQDHIMYVTTNGEIYTSGAPATQTDLAYVPMFELNLKNVLMISAADATDKGAINPALVSELTDITSWAAPPDSGKKLYKLTLSTGLSEFAISNLQDEYVVNTAAGTVGLNYTGAVTGADRTLSVLLRSEDGDQLYYSKLVSLDGATANGTVGIPIADLPDGSYDVLMFNEQHRGPNKTDYASAPVTFKLTVDNNAPKMNGSDPAHAATLVSIAKNTLSVRFNEKMSTDEAMQGTVTIDNGASLSETYNWSQSDTYVTFNLSGLQYDTFYTVTVEGFHDLAGNKMEASQSFSFTTADVDQTKPVVAATSPASGDENVPLTTQYLDITFNMDMDRSVIGTVSLDNQASVANGTWIQQDSHWRTIRYELSGLRGNTQYHINIEGFKNELGNVMDVDDTRYFHTESADGDQTPPVVQAIEPAHGSTTTPITTNKLAVIFNEEMDIENSTGTVSIDNGAVVSLSAAKWESTLKISYELLGLQYNTTYTLTISGFRDKAGNIMAPDQEHYFTTAKEDGSGGDPDPGPDPDPGKTPTILSTTPGNSATIAVTATTYSITFSHAMDTSASGTVSGNNSLVFTSPKWTNGNQTVEYTMGGLKAGTDYTVTISGFKNTGGLAISQTARTFKTQADGVDPNDTTKPTVASTDPASGDTVPYNQRKLSVTFSEAMDTSAGSVQVTGGSLSSKLTGESWSADGKTVTYDLPQLDYGTTYTLNISGYKDKAGNMLDADTARTILVSNTQYQVESPPVYTSGDTKFKVKEADHTKALGVLIKRGGKFEEVPADKVVFTKGSTVVELKESYLKDFEDKTTHDLRVLFTDGYADTKLSINKSNSGSNNNNNNSNNNNSSGNNSNGSSNGSGTSNGDKDNSNSGRD